MAMFLCTFPRCQSEARDEHYYQLVWKLQVTASFKDWFEIEKKHEHIILPLRLKMTL